MIREEGRSTIRGHTTRRSRDELGLVEEDDRIGQITVADFELAELDAAKSDFSSALPSAFSEVGVHTLKIMYDIILVCSDIIDL